MERRLKGLGFFVQPITFFPCLLKTFVGIGILCNNFVVVLVFLSVNEVRSAVENNHIHNSNFSGFTHPQLIQIKIPSSSRSCKSCRHKPASFLIKYLIRREPISRKAANSSGVSLIAACLVSPRFLAPEFGREPPWVDLVIFIYTEISQIFPVGAEPFINS